MPSQVLHCLFGEDLAVEICRRISPEFGIVADRTLKNIRYTHSEVFFLGCQGPDIFYHSQGRRPVGLEYGSLLHRRGAGSFTAWLLRMGMGLRRQEKEINALGVYALGFMTHAILDRLAHPYIVFKSSWLSPSKPEALRFARTHAFFERIIDVLMLKLLRGKEITGWDQEGILAETCEKPPLGLRELLAKALVRTYPERAGRDEKLKTRIENTFLDCVSFYRMTAPSQTASIKTPASGNFSLRKRHLVYIYPEELPGHIDFLNMEKQPWFYPSGNGAEDFRSFPELYADAVNTAADSLSGLISRYLEKGFFPVRETARAIGNGGLSTVDKNGKPCAPSRTAPLPLDEVLEQQAVLRGVG